MSQDTLLAQCLNVSLNSTLFTSLQSNNPATGSPLAGMRSTPLSRIRKTQTVVKVVCLSGLNGLQVALLQD
ncbi:hypothetical protein BT96DRAFT_992838 [Gymnopus androsaceus JB14]|uniref:Uncharacterized protein n=1 Tax=Gymnopus androsaceus JB14 TaxID=1447944 RepID=A0A6A4HRY8_9AGAR|nr:hypothetical protein BT96DRAFT_992838 [Gymnopus androsaceus JB14]